MSEKEKKLPRNTRIVATMHRELSKEVVWKRYYAFFDTAMPRAVQLAINYGSKGDFVEFYSREYGFQIGILRILGSGKFEMEMSPIVKSADNLLKLISADRESPLLKNLVRNSRGKQATTSSSATRH